MARTSPLSGWRFPESEMDWEEEGLCYKTNSTELFFSEVASEKAEARDTCHSCPVQGACHAYAMASNLAQGIWGGWDEHERHWLKIGKEFPLKRICPICDGWFYVVRNRETYCSRTCLRVSYRLKRKISPDEP